MKNKDILDAIDELDLKYVTSACAEKTDAQGNSDYLLRRGGGRRRVLNGSYRASR